jgi:hypothetical protein
MPLPRDIAASMESLSIRSLDMDLLGMGTAAAAYHHRQRTDRRDSDVMSDSMLHAGITFRMGEDLFDMSAAQAAPTAIAAASGATLVLPEVAITAPIEEEDTIDQFGPQ